MTPRPARAAVLAVLAALALLLVTAGPASAHATLVAASPTRGSEMADPPREVLLRFSEPVAIDRRSVEVYDAFGFRIDTGGPVYPGDDLSLVRIGLRAPLAEQSYLVVWRVVSADGHPAEGSYTFGYRVPARPAVSPTDLSDPLLGFLHGLARWAGLAGTTVLAGGAFFVAVLWRAGWQRRRVRRLLAGAWILTVASTLALLVLQGPYGTSLRLSDVTDPELLRLTLGTLFGKLLLLRLVSLLGAAAVWWQARRSGAAPGQWDVAGLALLAAESFSFGGHEGQGTFAPLTATVDAAHLLAAAVWIGGLTVLLTGLIPVAAARWEDDRLAVVLHRWSRVATGAVTVLAVTGVVQAWRGMGEWAALTTTAYGGLVLAKVGLLALVLAAAEFSRRAVARSAPSTVVGDGSPSVRRLRRSVGTETAVLAVVLGVTAALVNTVPGWQSYAPAWTTTTTARDGAGAAALVELTVDPVRLGTEILTVRATGPDGAPLALTGLTASLTQPQLGLGPIVVDGSATAPGRATATAAVPDPGAWTVELRLPAGGSTVYRTTLTYRVE